MSQYPDWKPCRLVLLEVIRLVDEEPEAPRSARLIGAAVGMGVATTSKHLNQLVALAYLHHGYHCHGDYIPTPRGRVAATEDRPPVGMVSCAAVQHRTFALRRETDQRNWATKATKTEKRSQL